MKEDFTDFIEVSGLLHYDPETISKIYKKNPKRLLKRLWQTLIPIFTYLFSVGWDKLTGRLKNEEKARFRAKELTNLLVELGPAFVKAGQALSTRPDIIPGILLEELSELQDQLPGFDGDKAMELIEEDLGSKIDEIFLEIDKEPISAASLGQVHKAKLKNEEIVAIKVQRPGLREQITLDLYIVRNIASWLKNNIGLIRSDLVALIDELGKRVFEEMDYLNEAKNAEKFRNMHKHNQMIAVPKIYQDITSRRVLTMEWIEGTKLTNLEDVKKLGIDPDKMIEIGVQCSLEQLLEHGFFHADPHPGNLAVSNEGKLIFYDFGMMGNISNNLQTRLGGMVKAVALRDASSLVCQLQEAGLISKDIDVGPVRRLVRLMLKEALTPPFSPNIIEKLSGDLYELVYETPFQLPVDLIFVMRALSTFEGVGRMLDPGFNLVSVTKPYLIELMTSNNQTPNDLINQFGRQVGELGSKAVGIPKRIDESLERLEQGDLQLQIRMGESDRQFKKMFTAQKTLGHSILIGSLSIASALLVTNKQNNFALLPLFFALPISIDWIKCQLSMRKGSRLEKLKR